MAFLINSASIDSRRIPSTTPLVPICPTLQIRAALRSVPAPARVDLVEVAGAGHFSFSTPFPPELTRPDFPPSQDPPGFDRAAYHATLRVELARFFTAALGVAA